mgnify:CR=1 FL=1|jgi:hypothetical protein
MGLLFTSSPKTQSLYGNFSLTSLLSDGELKQLEKMIFVVYHRLLPFYLKK